MPATCPRCGEPLDSGFVAASSALFSGIVWSATRLTIRGPRTKGGPDFHLLHRRHIGTVNFPAARCAACQLILMDYSQT